MGTTRQKNSCRNRLQNGPHSLLRMKVGTHSPLPTGSHTAAYTAKQGAFRMGGAITTLGAFRTFANIPGPGVRTAYFAALGSWPEGALEERREPAEQRCAYARRCSAGVAAPLGCVIFFRFYRNYGFHTLCSRLSACARHGWYHYPRRALRVAETPDGRLSKRLVCRFLASPM